MTIVKWHNHPNFSDMFDAFFNANEGENLSQKRYDCKPATNIIETDEGFELELAIPGMKKEDFKINIEKDVLTLSSDKESAGEEERNYTRREFVYGSFSRSYTLPKTIDQEKIAASYENGILKVALPKKAEDKSKLSREITIS